MTFTVASADCVLVCERLVSPDVRAAAMVLTFHTPGQHAASCVFGLPSYVFPQTGSSLVPNAWTGATPKNVKSSRWGDGCGRFTVDATIPIEGWFITQILAHFSAKVRVGGKDEPEDEEQGVVVPPKMTSR